MLEVGSDNNQLSVLAKFVGMLGDELINLV